MGSGTERGKAPREKGVELARPIVIVGREEGVVGVTASEKGRAPRGRVVELALPIASVG